MKKEMNSVNTEMKSARTPKVRKSLSVDIDTYNMLKEICDYERRSLINQLQVIIKYTHFVWSLAKDKNKNASIIDDDFSYSSNVTH